MNIACYYGQGYITLTVSESVFGGTVCGKAARTGLWGSGEVTNRSTRRFFFFFPLFLKGRELFFAWEGSQMGTRKVTPSRTKTEFNGPNTIIGGRKKMTSDY